MRQTIRTLLAAASLAALGCGDRNGVTNPAVDSSLYSHGDFRVSVSSGTTPTFTWSGGPGAVISVDAMDSGTTQWDLWPNDYDGSLDRIRSPIVYGSRPSGTEYATVTGARGLVKGRHYAVTVVRSDETYGVQEFVP